MKKISTHNNRVYNIWHNMKDRCNNHNNRSYKHYGEKGIKVCEEWLDKENGFINFYTWAINNGYKENLTIERINNNGNYEPSNCKWATMKEQHRNYSQNRLYTINGETKCLTEWCEIYNINYNTVISRIDKWKMNVLEALTKEINKNKIPKKYRKE